MYVSGLWVLAGKPQLTIAELMQLFLHQNQFGICIVPDPFPPCAGDVIHPVLLVWGRFTRLGDQGRWSATISDMVWNYT